MGIKAQADSDLRIYAPWFGVVMRITLQRALRILLALTLVMFILLNMHVLYNAPSSDINSHGLRSVDASQNQALALHMQQSSYYSPYVQTVNSAISPTNFDSTGNQTDSQRLYNQSNSPYNSEMLKQEVARINAEQIIHNLDKYQLNLSSDSLVIVIQAHDRHDYLRILVDSLRKVRDIEKSLLVISHDVYSSQMNDIIKSVDFCPVMQTFYPFSQQIYSSDFPGEHPNDCPRDIKKPEAIQRKCNNAEYPDKYGHYREAKYCQAKHHWIWKLHHLFEGIHVLKDYDGNIMLLEDDYFLSEDILFSTQKMREMWGSVCPDCRMLVLGNYEKNQNYPINGAKVERAFWISSKHNMGMTFNRSLWLDIKKCAKEFCTFDDYNWDWTLQHLSVTCIPNKVKLLVMKASRIFHIGECGMHKKSKNCDPVEKVKEAQNKLKENQQHLFPNVITVAGDSTMKLRDPKPNGGWGDRRDHELCDQYFNTTANR